MLILTVALLFPVALLLLVLVMERVERPLARNSMTEQLEAFLASAGPEEIETFVSEGYGPAIEQYWRKRSRRLQPNADSSPHEIGSASQLPQGLPA
jgi:hypothetical protein